MNEISVIIITYNRKDELLYTLDTLKKQDYSGLLEIVIIDQNSDDGTAEAISRLNDYDLKFIRLEKNLGVAGGRNIGVKNASYENMIFIDDDAHFVSTNALSEIEKIMNLNPNKVFAFQIRDLNNELFHWPYSNNKISKCEQNFLCNKFIGCGHAIKKSFFQSVNGYSNDLFFGFEETELVMKMFGTGDLPVLYSGKIKIIHRVTQTTRIKESKRFYYKVRNRLYVIRELEPLGGGLYFLYYTLAYLIRSIQYNLFTEFINGVIDALKTPVNKQYRMTYKNFIRYLTMNFK